MYMTRFSTWLCEIILVGDERGLTHLHLNSGQEKVPFHMNDQWERNDTFFETIRNQVIAYLDGTLRQFQIKIVPSGTDFQKKVWHQLCQIPYGKLATYGDIARAVGNPKAARAVGAAAGKNPVPLVIPCHRVVGANGNLTGFASGLSIKKQLIELERGSG